MQATRESKRGIEVFFFTLVALAILRVVLQSVTSVPLAIMPIANVVMACIFLGGPLLALCFAARDTWTRKMAFGFFGAGLGIQAVCLLLRKYVFMHEDIPAQVINALGQVGLPMWCVGLGAWLATLIKDKNIVVPIACFLAFLDMFLVFSPLGVTHQIISKVPSALPSIAVQVPMAIHQTNGQRVSPGALAGPADFMFLAMFLVAVFRFKMRGRATVLVVIPTLLCYMMVVTVLHISLPALVPIGTVVLLVNWKEFHLTKDEKISTAVVVAAGLCLFTWGEFQKPKVERVGPSSQVDGPRSSKSPNSPPITETIQ